MKINYKKPDQLKNLNADRINKMLEGFCPSPYDGKKGKKDRKQGKEVIISLEQN